MKGVGRGISSFVQNAVFLRGRETRGGRRGKEQVAGN